MTDDVPIRLTVNGQAREGRGETRKLLVDFLREDLGLTGTHVGCEHGVCGACTVLVDGLAARSCLMLAVQANGVELLTVEGLMTGDKLHPLQQAFHEHHGLQCGFCTPGMLLAALDFLNTNPTPTELEIRQGLSAVLCRCTGYQGIVKAVAAAAITLRETRCSRLPLRGRRRSDAAHRHLRPTSRGPATADRAGPLRGGPDAVRHGSRGIPEESSRPRASFRDRHGAGAGRRRRLRRRDRG